MAVDAASGWVLDELEDVKSVPKASRVTDIKVEKQGEFVNAVVLDMDAYSEKYGNKAVRKNLTIPSWLNTAAEKTISISQLFCSLRFLKSLVIIRNSLFI